jgi:hypothetical protein
MTHADWRTNIYNADVVYDIWDREHAGHHASTTLRSWPINTGSEPYRGCVKPCTRLPSRMAFAAVWTESMEKRKRPCGSASHAV